MQAEIILSLQCTGPNLPCGLHLVRWLLSLAGIERRAQIAGYTRTQPYNQAAYQNTRLVQYTVDDLLLFFLSVSWTCNLFDYENTSHIVKIVSSIFLGAKLFLCCFRGSVSERIFWWKVGRLLGLLVNEVNVNLEPPKWADAALVGMEKQGKL